MAGSLNAAPWPKTRAPLSPEQIRIMEDWYGYYLSQVLPTRYGRIDRFRHTYALKSYKPGARTLEIGPGNGSHLKFEAIDRETEYVGIELRSEIASDIEKRFPPVKVIIGDCQERIEFPDNHFDRVVAIHVLEHLPNLPAALDEISRVLRPDGRFSVIIPCEGGLAYSLGRRLTTQRVFEKRYKVPYAWMIRYDHVSTAAEVLTELRSRFRVIDQCFYPLRLPVIDGNLIIGLTLAPIKTNNADGAL